jgi:hypothetical protein
METAFDFNQPQQSEYLYAVSENVFLHIARNSHSTAVLYFTDSTGKMIPAPLDVLIYTYDYRDSAKKVQVEPIKDVYPLCYTDNYVVEQNKKSIVDIKKQRKWNINTV